MNNLKGEEFYDNYVERQKTMGVNHRHFSIINYLYRQGLKKTDDVLEIGAGIGPVTGLIANYVKEGRIVANDLSGESLKEAKSRLKKFKNIEYLKGNILETEVKGTFDFIVLPDVLEHIPILEHKSLFEKMNSLLKRDGKIFIHIPNPFYLDWVRKNRPDLLQEVDQPLFLEILIDNIVNADLYIFFLEKYSIYIKENDYEVIVLKRKLPKASFTDQNIKADSFIKKVQRRIFGR